MSYTMRFRKRCADETDTDYSKLSLGEYIIWLETKLETILTHKHKCSTCNKEIEAEVEIFRNKLLGVQK